MHSWTEINSMNQFAGNSVKTSRNIGGICNSRSFLQSRLLSTIQKQLTLHNAELQDPVNISYQIWEVHWGPNPLNNLLRTFVTYGMCTPWISTKIICKGC